MRIVAGSAKGRTLAAPKSDDVIRPTADRVRETLFNVLGQTCDGLAVLDLYAGTGALGLEAVSRGAVKAVLVDRDPESLALCRQNTATLKFEKQIEIVKNDALKSIEQLARRGDRFELVFADPPYKQNVGLQILRTLDASNVVHDQGVAVIETGRDEELPEREGRFERIDEREFGVTTVRIFRFTSAPA
ncbi:MAG: 16S rRNA (guanine(966)-N(2))-methyltransferase RsmD [Archangium sp.]